jgi:hypothetical protein
MHPRFAPLQLFLAALAMPLLASTSRPVLDDIIPESRTSAPSREATRNSALEAFIRIVQEADEATKKAQAKGDIEWDAFSAGRTLWTAAQNGLGAELAPAAQIYLRAFAERLAQARAGDLLDAAWADPNVEVVRALNAQPAAELSSIKPLGETRVKELCMTFAGLAVLTREDADTSGLRFAALSQLLMTQCLATSTIDEGSEPRVFTTDVLMEINREVSRSTLALWWLCDRRGLSLDQKLLIRQCLLRRGDPAWSRSIARLLRRDLERLTPELAKDDQSRTDMAKRAEAIIQAFERSDDLGSFSEAWESIQSVQQAQLDPLTGPEQDKIRIDRRAFQTYRAMRAEWLGLVTTLGVRAYKDVYGSFPESSEALRRSGFGEIGPDASSGKNIRLRRIGDRFLLYSFGADGLDNDGKALAETARPWGAFTSSDRDPPSDRVWVDER